MLYFMKMFFQLNSSRNHWRTVWKEEDLLKTPICKLDLDTMTQANVDFTNCVSNRVNIDYSVPYDFNSIMHYGLK